MNNCLNYIESYLIQKTFSFLSISIHFRKRVLRNHYVRYSGIFHYHQYYTKSRRVSCKGNTTQFPFQFIVIVSKFPIICIYDFQSPYRNVLITLAGMSISWDWLVFPPCEAKVPIRFLLYLQIPTHKLVLGKFRIVQSSCSIVNEYNQIVGIGYNGFPRGCSDDLLPWGREAENELDTKYMYVCHAEMNAILNINTANARGCKVYYC